MNKVENLIKFAYKTLIISGSIMLTNDAAWHMGFTKQTTSFGRIARNSAATATGYVVGKKIADETWDVIEEAANRYREA